MRKKLALILFFSFWISAQAQQKEENLYVRGLRACLEKEVEQYSKFSDADLYNILVLSDYKLTGELPAKIGKFNLEYLEGARLIEKFKSLTKTRYKERGAIPVIEIFPLSDKNNKLLFGYNNFWYRRTVKSGFFSKRKIADSFGLEGGCRVEIGFDSPQQKFVIEKVELWGV
ncbi:MAG TPA: hypothetical protein VK400_06315 [Pyrinomonadaceae bacterium]|nr:hypothetical protein [Pyrinomonadaceae bacterium]